MISNALHVLASSTCCLHVQLHLYIHSFSCTSTYIYLRRYTYMYLRAKKTYMYESNRPTRPSRPLRSPDLNAQPTGRRRTPYHAHKPSGTVRTPPKTAHPSAGPTRPNINTSYNPHQKRDQPTYPLAHARTTDHRRIRTPHRPTRTPTPWALSPR